MDDVAVKSASCNVDADKVSRLCRWPSSAGIKSHRHCEFAQAVGLQWSCRDATAKLMTDGPQARLLSALERLPDWLRRDLAAKEEGVRRRAEEALAAMLASVLETQPQN